MKRFEEIVVNKIPKRSAAYSSKYVQSVAYTTYYGSLKTRFFRINLKRNYITDNLKCKMCIVTFNYIYTHTHHSTICAHLMFDVKRLQEQSLQLTE